MAVMAVVMVVQVLVILVVVVVIGGGGGGNGIVSSLENIAKSSFQPHPHRRHSHE
jgi:Na+/pantothenate symporter